MGSKCYPTYFIVLFCTALSINSYAQNIGHKLSTYVPVSETVNGNLIPITPAIENFTAWIKESIQTQLRDVKKNDDSYDIIRKEVIKKASLHSAAAFISLIEFESLRPFDFEEAKLSLYYFLDCWEKKNFKSKNKDFCKGCWAENIERERFYYDKYAHLED